MASIASDKNGNRRILFMAPDGRRPTIRLGKMSKRAAEGVKYRIEQLLAAKRTGHPLDADTSAWIASLEPAIATKLVRVGLIPKAEGTGSIGLRAFLDDYIVTRHDLKQSTIDHLKRAADCLVGFLAPRNP